MIPTAAIVSTFGVPEDRVAALVHRFNDRVSDPTGGCRLWLGGLATKKNGTAYGRLTCCMNGRVFIVYAHRLSFVLHKGRPIEDGVEICHSCDVPLCVEVEHLFEGSQAENIADMRKKGRGVNPPFSTGEQHHLAHLPDNRVAEIRSRVGVQQRVLAKEFGVSQSTIWRLLHNVTRKTA